MLFTQVQAQVLAAGISWEPEIRGALSVVAGVAILMGSVYLLLATNLASRLGFLVALAGFFGWMVLMGLTWWIYGLGWQGSDSHWEVQEVNTGRLDQAILPEARTLQDADLPPAEEIDELSLDEFDDLAEDYRDELGGWTLLSPGDPTRGEAQAAVDEALTGDAYPAFTNPQDYVVMYGMRIGGKPERESDSVLDRTANRITNTFRPTHPPHYLIVQVQPAIFQETVPGEPPPIPEADPDADTVSVVMIRDIGDRRLPAAMTTIVSAAIFLLLCYMLHVRDKTLQANRSAPLPEPVSQAPAEPEPTGAKS